MSHQLALLIGPTVAIFVLILLAKTVNAENNIWFSLLKFFLITMSVFGLLIVGQAGLEISEDCQLVLNNTVEIENAELGNQIANTTVVYNYHELCYGSTDDHGSAINLYTLLMWIVRIVVAFFMIYFIWHIIDHLRRSDVG